MEFEYDTKNILYVRIDRKRKFLGSIFLRALGMKTNEEILRTFYQVERIALRDGDLWWNVSEGLVDRKLSHEIKNPRSEEVIVAAHKRITEPLYKELVKAKVAQARVSVADLEGAYTVADLVNRQTGEVILEANKPVTADLFGTLAEAGINSVDVFFPERDDVGVVLSRTLDKDAIRSSREALIEIYRKLRPGDPPTLETATALFNGMFFDPRKYDFSKVGRLKFNIKLGLETPLENRTLDSTDFVAAIRYLLKLRRNVGSVDDIDHLGNRRVRAVGELLENQFRIGLVRMERAIKEKMSVYQEMSTAMPHDLVNAKPVMAAIREFFGSSQLSQFMDQTNPLSEITHKRRLSALGPGGLVARARRIRSARRSPHALRPHLPDRDAGRPEHRLDQLAFLLRADQRIRLHRVALPQGQGRARHRLRANRERRRQRVQGRRDRRTRQSRRRERRAQAPPHHRRAVLLLSLRVGRGPLRRGAGQRCRSTSAAASPPNW